jgi:glycosyltransferase involved in cell wall biosynthesis
MAGKICHALSVALPSGVELLGWLEDVDEFYRQLRVVVNPVLRGTGLKIKSVEALSHGRPLISTPIGLEGLEWNGQLPWRIASDHQSMTDACIELLKDPRECDAMADQATILSHRMLRSDQVYSDLLPIVANCKRKLN